MYAESAPRWLVSQGRSKEVADFRDKLRQRLAKTRIGSFRKTRNISFGRYGWIPGSFVLFKREGRRRPAMGTTIKAMISLLLAT